MKKVDSLASSSSLRVDVAKLVKVFAVVAPSAKSSSQWEARDGA
jgi:hypothetical protein